MGITLGDVVVETSSSSLNALPGELIGEDAGLVLSKVREPCPKEKASLFSVCNHNLESSLSRVSTSAMDGLEVGS
jgi:hypothetical protein